MKKLISLISLIATLSHSQAFAVGKIQNEDVKSVTDLTNAGSDQSHLINDDKVYVKANSINSTLNAAIVAGTIGGGGGGNGADFLANASFEAGVSSGWTTTTVTSSNDTTNFTDGIQSALLTYSATSGDIAQSVTPTVQLSGVNMQAGCYVKTSLTTMQVCSLVGGTETNCQPVPATGSWVAVNSSFVGPSSGSIGVRVKTTTSTTGTANVDQCYVGKAVNTAMLSQAQQVGTLTYAPTSGCDWSTASTSFTNYSAQVSCPAPSVTGSIAAPGTKIPAIVLNNIAPGTYEVTAQFEGGRGGSAGSYMAWALTDGTTTSGQNSTYFNTSTFYAPMTLTGIFTYTTAQSSVTINVQGETQSGSNTAHIFADTANSNSPLFFTVKMLPTQQQAGYRPDQTPASWSGYQDSVASGCQASGSTLADPSACTGITLHELQNRNFGTVATAGSSLPGLLLTFPRQGKYSICATPSVTTSSASADAAIQIVDGSSNVVARAVGWSSSANAVGSTSICGIYNALSAGQQTIKLWLATDSGNFKITQALNGSAVQWQILELDGAISAPYLVGLNLSASSGITHTDSAYIANNGSTATISYETGNWISSVTRTATGNVTLVFSAGEFSSAPACTTTVVSGSNSLMQLLTLTSSQFTTQGVNFSFAAHDSDFTVTCQGPH